MPVAVTMIVGQRMAVRRSVGMSVLVFVAMMCMGMRVTSSVDVHMLLLMDVIVGKYCHLSGSKIDERGFCPVTASAGRAHQAASSSCIVVILSSSPLSRST